MSTIVQNIDERKKIEEKLKTDHAFLDAVITKAGEGICVCHQTEEYPYVGFTIWNDRMTQITGYTMDEINRLGWYQSLYPDQEIQKLAMERMTRMRMGDDIIGEEWEIVRKDGQKRTLRISTSIIEKGSGDVHVLVLMDDVTVLKNTLESLRQERDRIERIAQTSPSGIVFVNAAGEIVYANEKAQKVLGLTKNEITQRCYNSPDWKITDFDGNSFPEDQLPFTLVSKTKNSVVNLQHAIEWPSGQRILLSINASPSFDSAGLFNGMVATIEDITEQKKLESNLQQSLKMEAIGTLAGGIAHDFNNILMGIQGMASILLAEMDKCHPCSEHVLSIEKYVKSASELTDQLLGFARGGKYEVKPTNLNHVIEQAVHLFGRTKKEIRIEKKYESKIWAVEVDRRQIEQVLLNLFVNAAQAMPGGGNLYLGTENVQIERKDIFPFSINPGRYVKISVADTGVGMDAATRARIFEPFFTTKEKGRGTGLGLASAYGIIKNHNGLINVYSEKNKGTEFAIYLPAIDKEVIENTESIEKQVAGTGTIFLVDDEEIIIEVTGLMLEKLGYKVIIARNGKEAIDIFKRNKREIDIVILDMIMPDLGGGDVFNELKTIDPEVKVILSSGYSIDGAATEILNRGCRGFIQKPFTINQISEKLNHIIR